MRKFVLFDPDNVEWSNLTRTVYGCADVGRPKVQALANHLTSIFPDIEVEMHQEPIQAAGSGLKEMLGRVDVAIGAADDPAASGRLNRYAYGAGTCAVFVSLYRGAKGGEVILSLPELTPCLFCSTGSRARLADGAEEQIERERDYGTSRLVAEIALGSDIHMVSAAGVKLVLSLLCMEDSSSTLGDFVVRAIQARTHAVLMGMYPDYLVFPKSHRDAFGQYAFQSLWMTSESLPSCSVCGEPSARETPL